jgi:predicted RNA binding protein YcfA (HicA-like mRNA interferase family)
MPKLPRLTPRKLVAALRRLGFFVDRQRGSHAILRHPDGRMTVVPLHAKDMPTGTLGGILHDIDVSSEELKKHL